MKKDRSELNKYLLSQCEKLTFQAEKCSEIRKYLFEKYDIPTGLTMDMISRGKIEGQTNHIAYCLLEGILNITSEKNVIEEFFVPAEAAMFSKTPMPKDKFKFPIVIKCNQVADDQWIGATDTNFFMELRKAQMINYNENTQRALTKIITNNGVYYNITVEESTVSGIRKTLQRGEYIPTPITLNIPLDHDANFYYDEDQGVLIINSLDYFDIIDGYHRYVAMFREKDVNPNFNCQWELRIVNFAEDKAKYFIYQENLKTKMTKIDSNAMNSYNASNRIVTMLNQDSSFSLFGEINNTGGIISAAELGKVIEAFYCKNIKNTNETKIVQNVKVELKNKFNCLVDFDDSYLSKTYGYKELICIIYTFIKNEDNYNAIKIDAEIKHMLKNITKIKPTKLAPSKDITKSLITDLDKIYEEVLQ